MADSSSVMCVLKDLNLSENESDNNSLPEYFIPSEYLQDPYESDISMEHQQKEKMLQELLIDGSDVLPWELDYFLHFRFENYRAKHSIENIRAQGLLEDAFNMFFPGGLPQSYIQKYIRMENKSMSSIVKILYQQFFSTNVNKWFMEHFQYNFDNLSKIDIQDIREQLIKYLNMSSHNLEDILMLEPAYELAGRFTDVMDCLITDDDRTKIPKGDPSKNERHELVKGLVYQMLTYLGVQIMYTGEGTYDFQHKHIPGRINKEAVTFNLKPDASMFIRTDKGRSPIGVVKVHGSYSKDVLENLINSSQSQDDEKKTKATLTMTIQEQDSKNNCDNLVTHKDLKKIDKTTEEARLVTSSNNEIKSIQGKTNCAYDASTQAIKPTTKCKHWGPDVSSYKCCNKVDINNKIKRQGPSACANKLVFSKFYGQLPLEMYGLLIKKDEHLRQHIDILPYCKPYFNGSESWKNSLLVGLGMFAMNECIYLVKITDMRKHLPMASAEAQSFGPTLTYAKNFCFNLRNPEHRFAFLCFMFHYYHIVQSLNVEETQYIYDCQMQILKQRRARNTTSKQISMKRCHHRIN